MGTLFGTLEKHHRLIIGVQAFLLAFFVLACTFHDVIPVCHYLFGSRSLHVRTMPRWGLIWIPIPWSLGTGRDRRAESA
jgi:hypothetical protein